MNNHYYILGAGITGLVTAYELLKKGCDVTILEKDSQVGGLAKTLIWHDIPIDLGPHIYHTPDQDILDYWLKEFDGLFLERDHWSKNFKNGEYFDYPISHEFINTLPEKIQTKIKEDLKNINNDKRANNYYEYIKSLVGPTLQEMFFIKYPEKLWGMGVKELDANWAPKRINFREKSTPFYWGQWSAVGNEGSGSIIKNLEKKIRNLGGNILLNTPIKKLELINNQIVSIISNEKVTLNPKDIVINTTSYTTLSKLIKHKTELKYRGVTLVYLFINKKSVFPHGIDFIYIDDPKISFNRVSEQSQFIKQPLGDKNVYICEIAYNEGDKIDQMDEKELIDLVINDFISLGFIGHKDVLDSKVIKLPEVYPMFFLGYQKAFAKTKSTVDQIVNLYNKGSLAEYHYSDLQVLFSKAIDLADLLTSKTLKINKIDKTIPRLKFKKRFRINDKKIGKKQPVFVIAEIGLNHNGDIDLAKKLIDEAIGAGADAVKLQSYKAENRVAKNGKTSKYVEKILGIEETDYEMLKKNELSYEQTKELFDYAKNRITIFSAPFDLESVDDLENLGVDCYKIASFDLINIPLIRKVAKTGKPMILSTGMGNLSEIEEALQAILIEGNNSVAVLQCTSSYPCPPENMNIKAIDTIRKAFKLPVGLSDHVIGDTVSLAAVARGANIIEKHFTLDQQMEGPDHILSLEPNELKQMVEKIRIIEESLGDGIKQASSNEFNTMLRFRKTLYTKKAIKAGEKITEDKIIIKGPAFGIYPKYLDIVLGQVAVHDMQKDHPIQWEDIVNA